MLEIAVLVSGGGTNLQAIIDEIETGRLNCKIVKVIGSKQNIYALERAKKYNIPTEVIEKKQFISAEAFDVALSEAVLQSKAGLIVLAGCLYILGPTFVSSFSNRIINVHPSLIPSFCGKGFYGLKVHEAALKAGVKVSGATVHFVDYGCDSGPIILQKAVDVLDDDTSESLQKRVMVEAEWILLPKAIGLIEEKRISIVNNKVKIRGRKE